MKIKSKKITIGIFVETISYNSGARAPLEIVKHIDKKKFTIILYAYDILFDRVAQEDLHKVGIKTVIVKKSSLPFFGKYMSTVSLIRKMHKESLDVICFAGTLPSFIAAKLTHLPILTTYYGTQPDAYLERKNPNEKITLVDTMLNTLGNWYIFCTNFLLVNLSTKVIAISKFSATEMHEFYHRKADAIIYLGTTAINDATKTTEKEKHEHVRLLAVSRITPYKGFHILLDCINSIENVKFVIAGALSKKKYLTYLQKRITKNVKIFVNPSDKKLSQLYKQSDIYVNADKYLYFGLPIFEAAYYKKPTVSFNFAAANEIIQHKKTGFIANNKNEFISYLSLLTKRKKLRQLLGSHAKEFSQTFSWERCAKKWEHMIQKTINH